MFGNIRAVTSLPRGRGAAGLPDCVLAAPRPWGRSKMARKLPHPIARKLPKTILMFWIAPQEPGIVPPKMWKHRLNLPRVLGPCIQTGE